MRKAIIIVGAVVLAVLSVVGAWWFLAGPGAAIAPPLYKPAVVECGGQARSGEGHAAGYGWSVNPDTNKAVEQALSAAWGDERRSAQIVFVAYTCNHAPGEIVRAIRARVGEETRIFGRSSDYGVVSPDGYHYSPQGTIGVLPLRIDGMAAGVGAATLDECGSPEACATRALERAQADAGIAGADVPSMVLMYPTFDGLEETYVETITRLTGGRSPILGGTVGGSKGGAFVGAKDCSAIANDTVARKGLAVAVFKTSRPFAWAFGGGYTKTAKSGVVTAARGKEILEIDGRPALDVYDEWSGGKVTEKQRTGEQLEMFSALYPLCRQVARDGMTGDLFICVNPAEDDWRTRRLVCIANRMNKGDRVFFCEGAWNILLNQIGRLPQQAMGQGHYDTPMVAGVLICCEAVLLVIPESQRDHIPEMLNRQLGNMPWLGAFSWGETGNFPGIGNYHGNLLNSLTLFPAGANEDKR